MPAAAPDAVEEQHAAKQEDPEEPRDTQEDPKEIDEEPKELPLAPPSPNSPRLILTARRSGFAPQRYGRYCNRLLQLSIAPCS